MKIKEENKQDAFRIYNYFGAESQEDKLIEEMSELAQALLKHRYDFSVDNYNHVAEEMADVVFMLMQCSIPYIKSEKELHKHIRSKANRTIRRIIDGYYEAAEQNREG